MRTSRTFNRKTTVADLEQFKPEFNLRQCNFLFVKAVESKFNEEMKPDYVKELEDQVNRSLQKKDSALNLLSNMNMSEGEGL